jgi:hypothetical protein
MDKAQLIEKVKELERQVHDQKLRLQKVDEKTWQRDLLASLERQIHMEQFIMNLESQNSVLQERWIMLRKMLEDLGLEFPDEVFHDLFKKNLPENSQMQWLKTLAKLEKKPWTLYNYRDVLHHVQTMYEHLSLSTQEVKDVNASAKVKHPYSFYNQKYNRVEKKLEQFMDRCKKRFGAANAPKYNIYWKDTNAEYKEYSIVYTRPSGKKEIEVSRISLPKGDEKIAHLYNQTKLLRFLQLPAEVEIHCDKDILQVGAVNLKETFCEIHQNLFNACKNNAQECRHMMEELMKATKQGYKSR